MAQSAVTVRLDSEMKSQFDELCGQFGMKNIEVAKGLYIKTFLWDRTKGLVEYEFNNGSVYHRLQ